MTKEEWLKIGEENGYNTSTTVTKPNWGGVYNSISIL